MAKYKRSFAITAITLSTNLLFSTFERDNAFDLARYSGAAELKPDRRSGSY